MKTKLYTLFFCLLLTLFNAKAQVAVTATAGTTAANYTTVNDAFAAINAGTHQGAIVITVTANTTEPAIPTPLLKSSAPSNYTSIKIKPQGNVTINSNVNHTAARAVLELVGADNVTIDGDDAATPNKQNLTIQVEASVTPLTAAISLGSKGRTDNDGDSNIVIKNCIIIGSHPSSTHAAKSWGICFTNNMNVPTITDPAFTSSFAHSHKKITIDSNIIKRAFWGIYAVGNDTFPNSNITITNNTIGDALNSDNIAFRGIYISNSSGNAAMPAIIRNNDIRAGDDISGGISANHVAGLEIAGGNSGIVVDKNNIHDIYHMPSSATAWGIVITGDNNGINITNNFITNVAAGLNGGSVTAHFGVYGIYSFSATAKNINLTNNTIVLNTQNAGGGNIANAVSACVQVITSSPVNAFSKIANNIFSNNQNSTRAYCIIANDTANIYSALVNNNCYYSTIGSVGYYKGSDGKTLQNWQQLILKDNASINVDPTFVAFSDFHLLTTQSELESAGMPTTISGVADDVDGQTRPGPVGSTNGGAKNPDIGADEFDGIIVDVTAAFINYTPLGKVCNNADRVLSNVVISDAKGIALTGSNVPRIYFRKNGNAWVSAAGSLVSGNANNSTWNFTISSSAMGGINANDYVSYFILVQDVSVNPIIGSMPFGAVATSVNNLTTAPAVPNQYLVGASLNGKYTVGTGGQFATIGDAVAAYHASCLSGHVVFELINTNYTETYPIVINQHPDASATQTLTIKPAAGVAVVLNGNVSSFFTLNGADYITIDGSDNGSYKRGISFNNSNTSASSCIAINSLGNNKGAVHNSLKNLNIIGGDPSTTNINGLNIGGADNDTLLVENCFINNVNVAINANNTSTTNMMDSLNIINNEMGGSSPNSIGFKGITISSTNNTIISGNVMRNGYTDVFRFLYGIELFTRNTNCKIVNNNIHDFVNDYSGGNGVWGIGITSSNANSDILIANNFISKIVCNNPSNFSWTSNAAGMRISGGNNLKIYHNSINIAGAPTSNKTGIFSSGIVFSNPYATGVEVKNNIFANTQSLLGQNSYTYGIYIGNIGITFQSIDYNNYYGADVNNTTFAVGYGAGVKRTLANWSSYIGGDTHSLSVAPNFVSDTNLHINSGNTISELESAVPLLADVVRDYDNEVRPGPTGSTNGGAIAGKADVGADEFDRKPLACQTPTNIRATAIGISTATIVFDALVPAPANGYEYVISPSNTLPIGTGTAFVGNTINLTGLQEDFTYYVFIRAICGASIFGNWSAVYSFTTNCVSTSIPYVENFDAVTIPALPACTLSQDINIGGNTWTTRGPWFSGETGFILQYVATPTVAANSWFYTRGLDLTAGTTYIVGFKYSSSTANKNFAEKLRVAYGTANTATAMTNIFFDSSNIQNNKYVVVTPKFTAPTTGVYYLGFNVYSNANQNTLLLDSISVTASTVPVNFIDYAVTHAKVQSKYAAKNRWQVGNEINVAKYFIQRSNNGVNFENIGTVFPNKNFVYEFTDYELPKNVTNIFYRIVGVDMDGSKTYSQTKSFNLNRSLLNIAVFPNPANDFVTIESNEGIKEIRIFDELGREIESYAPKSDGNTSYKVQLKHYAKGVYSVHITSKKDDIYISKLIKL